MFCPNPVKSVILDLVLRYHHDYKISSLLDIAVVVRYHCGCEILLWLQEITMVTRYHHFMDISRLIECLSCHCMLAMYHFNICFWHKVPFNCRMKFSKCFLKKIKVLKGRFCSTFCLAHFVVLFYICFQMPDFCPRTTIVIDVKPPQIMDEN